MTNQPIKQCYWVVMNKFLAGEYPRTTDDKSSQEKISSLLSAGVTSFIDLTEENEGLLPYAHFLDAHKPNGVSYQRFPIRMFPYHLQETSLQKFLMRLIIISEMAGWSIFIVGRGRSNRVIVGCWLARHGCGGKSALSRLHELWRKCPKSSIRKSPETKEQEQYILEWEDSR